MALQFIDTMPEILTQQQKSIFSRILEFVRMQYKYKPTWHGTLQKCWPYSDYYDRLYVYGDVIFHGMQLIIIYVGNINNV